MKASEEIEPGVLPTFRLFVGVQLVITGLGVITHWLVVPFRLQSAMGTLAMFSVVEPGALFLYLSIPCVRRKMQSFYLQIAIAWAAAGSILDP